MFARATGSFAGETPAVRSCGDPEIRQTQAM
jgi:hypothetical protein